MSFENFEPDPDPIPENRVVVCITCASTATTTQDHEAHVWNNCAWNITRANEEEEAYLHAKNNPTHIMTFVQDFGYKVNKV